MMGILAPITLGRYQLVKALAERLRATIGNYSLALMEAQYQHHHQAQLMEAEIKR
jgi:hypothetical protein